MPQPRKPKTTTPAAVVLTPYIVLRAIPLDDKLRDDLGMANTLTSTLWTPMLNEKADDGPDGEARVIKARNAAAAIRVVTGPDGPDIVEGTWKAVALTSWKGGQVTRRVMKSDRLPLDEALG